MTIHINRIANTSTIESWSYDATRENSGYQFEGKFNCPVMAAIHAGAELGMKILIRSNNHVNPTYING